MNLQEVKSTYFLLDKMTVVELHDVIFLKNQAEISMMKTEVAIL